MARSKPRFLRNDTNRHIRIGKKKRSLQKWRKARGRHNKIRRKMTGHPVSPSIGYGRDKKHSGLINGKSPVLVNSLNDFNSVDNKTQIVIISSRVGAKKRLEMIKLANEKGIHLNNISGDKK